MRLWLVAVIVGGAVIACSTSDGGAGGGGNGAPAPDVVAEGTIGPVGGTVKGDGVTLDIPRSALGSDQKIRITRTTDEAPAGFLARTPVYRFEPEGLVFIKPAHVSFAITDSELRDDVLWSKPDKSGFERLGALVTATSLSADVLHFSEGFVARIPGEDVDASTSGEGGGDAATDANCECATGLSCCGGSCVSTGTSSTNCGGCGKVCGTATPVCINGVCSAPSG